AARTRGEPLRAWSPLVSFPAVQAADVMTAALRSTGASASTARPAYAESMAALEYVAPRDVSEQRQGQPTINESTRNRLENAVRRIEARKRDERDQREALAGAVERAGHTVTPAVSAQTSATQTGATQTSATQTSATQTGAASPAAFAPAARTPSSAAELFAR